MKLVALILLITVSLGCPQGRPYEGPEDPAGDIAAEREGYFNGNRVLLYYLNNTEMGGWLKPETSKWPNNYEGTQMLDKASILIGSEVYLYQDSIPVTDMDEVARLRDSGELDVLYFIQSHTYFDYQDLNYDQTVEWALYPVPGYANEANDYVAINNKPDSWPAAGWPSTGFEKKWPGEWNGRFGRGIHYADFETYFVANDAQDLEYIVRRNDPDQKLITDGPRYYPRPGRYIGDINPAVTIQRGYPWGGLGVRVAVRGYQWNNPEARDIIFFEYDISNISDYDLPMSGFGFYIDTEVGGEHTGGDAAYFNRNLDLAYAWDYDGLGVGGFYPGTFGTAFLESPGKAFDRQDNDDDGLVDEQRDNPAGELIGPQDGIASLSKFLSFYHLQQGDLRQHFAGDEDQDWRDGNDLNHNGAYATQDEFGVWQPDPGESAGDDVGLDGVGPFDLNYNGPDEGEGNHQPDFSEGVGCEPNFAATDVNESDMLGLTSFYLYDYAQSVQNDWWPRNDKSYWDMISSGNFELISPIPAYTAFYTFGSATFALHKGRTERISTAMLHSYETLQDLNSDEHLVPNLLRQKQVAQTIYERDYRFAQPPELPVLSATAADSKVLLSWDDRADRFTREPFMDNKNDFEGYKIYRATDKLFSDAEVITDGHGAKKFKSPLFQCDLIDGRFGYAEYGLVDGRAFYLGDDTGITHHFVDENVENGRTYYYAVVAYDYGLQGESFSISPTENNVVIELNEAEEVIRTSQNVQVVTPRSTAAGYVAPHVENEQSPEIRGSGTVVAEVFDKEAVKPGHTYKVVFNVDTLGYHYNIAGTKHPFDWARINNGLRVFDATEQRLVYREGSGRFPFNNILDDGELSVRPHAVRFEYYNTERELVSDIFDGLRLRFTVPTIAGEYDAENSGWLTGNAPITVKPSTFNTEQTFAYTYDIVFTDVDTATIGFPPTVRGTRELADGSTNGPDRKPIELIYNEHFPFYIENKTLLNAEGEHERLGLVVHDKNKNGVYDLFEDEVLAGHLNVKAGVLGQRVYYGGTVLSVSFENLVDESQMPEPDDIYRLVYKRPFFDTDTLTFTVAAEVEADTRLLDSQMDKIKVVPNPYIATNAMEPAVGNKFLNQRRRLMFTHIPARSTIRIFTSSGVPVDVIEVDSEPSNGIIYWDLLSREGLEVAAGMYVYHVKSKITGKEKTGKFAVIK